MTAVKPEPDHIVPNEGNGTPVLELEEYRAIVAQIQSYIQQRNTVLAIVVAAFASLLGLGSKENSLAVTLAMFAVLIGGGVLTWDCVYHILRRAGYLSVAVEGKYEKLNGSSSAGRPWRFGPQCLGQTRSHSVTSCGRGGRSSILRNSSQRS